MRLEQRIKAFIALGERIKALEGDEFLSLARRAENGNSWFTSASISDALKALTVMLEASSLKDWVGQYDIPDRLKGKKVGVMMAGNVPAVGFHDLLCVLMTGHELHAKPSTSDEVLIKWLAAELLKIEPAFGPFLTFEEMLKGKDAYIATGSDNTARYFEYYFGKYEHIIRKNRTSVAILDGKESKEDYVSLAKDIFQYYGLGCRNISKIYLKDESQLQNFLASIEEFNPIIHHHKYRNNYDYNKSIYLVNQQPHLDNGFLLLTKNSSLVSPIAVLYYELYENEEAVMQAIESEEDKIQCKVSRLGLIPGSIPFGEAQNPKVNEYADNVDTMEFLAGLYKK
ncbi:acyl-CoA reductase [Anditalea andensis]|uniref:Acyl-CoA reductase n=1 Tax=Anditalea andensis TaxID=1048983 RepID=A0A074KV68_9BACT|nr:acyl-CoA reductase [Anditalea andensis]KEO73881.1 acyl-CoA reductase [Anditalea andensis]